MKHLPWFFPSMRYFSVFFLIGIALLSSCKKPLEEQILGKWQKVQVGRECIEFWAHGKFGIYSTNEKVNNLGGTWVFKPDGKLEMKLKSGNIEKALLISMLFAEDDVMLFVDDTGKATYLFNNSTFSEKDYSPQHLRMSMKPEEIIAHMEFKQAKSRQDYAAMYAQDVLQMLRKKDGIPPTVTTLAISLYEAKDGKIDSVWVGGILYDTATQRIIEMPREIKL